MTPCTYCGEPGNTRDHIIPYSYTGRLPRKARSGGADAGKTVPACKDCNSILGDVLLVTAEDRKARIRGFLSGRLVKLKLPEWTSEELEELGPNLRSALEAAYNERRAIIRRLAFIESSTTPTKVQ